MVLEMCSVVAVFIALKTVGWFGYQTPQLGQLIVHQSDLLLLAIRILTGPVAIVLLFPAIICTHYYPITLERLMRIRHF
jgi:Na+/melibiose symporter-like transporter